MEYLRPVRYNISGPMIYREVSRMTNQLPQVAIMKLPSDSLWPGHKLPFIFMNICRKMCVYTGRGQLMSR